MNPTFIFNWVDQNALSASLYLIILLPLIGAFVSGVFGRVLGRANTNLVATAAVAGSFVLSLIAFIVVNNADATAANAYGDPVRFALGHDYGVWFQAGSFRVNMGLQVDHLTGSLLLVITGIGFLIHLYSTNYMSHDDGYWRFFAYLNLFVAMMLTLVMADNLVLLFVGWEGVGMCSYLLIGFWYRNPNYAFAGRKAFVTNRIGDFGFLIASFLLVVLIGAFSAQAPQDNFRRRDGSGAKWKQGLNEAGPLNFHALEELARVLPVDQEKAGNEKTVTLKTEINNGPLRGRTYGGVLTAILLLFLLGAAGKSAQIPLYVWLPDAMAGPTPVSALIHAATMVTAGVYLFCRISYLLVLSPVAMATIAMIGACTALLAALIAFAQDDLKKILAYSTVSQLGFMFLAVGVGAFWAAAFHLITHACFKACLFLGAGSVMHGNADETDVKRLGGLRKEMKVTWATFLVATLAITGVVPLSGFFSKDAILHAAHTHQVEGMEAWTHLAWILGTITALCTAFYMARAYLLTFEGKRAANARIPHAHESAWPITVPLVVLAVLSVLTAGYVLHWVPGGQEIHEPLLQNFLMPVFMVTDYVAQNQHTLTVPAEEGSMAGVYVQAWLIALIGAGSAAFLYLWYFPKNANKPAPAPLQFFRRLSQNKFYVDELYDTLVIRPIKFMSFVFYRVVDALMIDTVAVRGTAWVTARMGSALRYLQTGDVQSYATVMALAAAAGLAWALFKVMQ